MSFTGFLVLVLVVVVLFAMLGAFFDSPGNGEVVTTTTTYDEEERTPPVNVVGNLKRHFTEGDRPQAFVIDPVDGERVYLNSNDDMYEDADGKVWRLV